MRPAGHLGHERVSFRPIRPFRLPAEAGLARQHVTLRRPFHSGDTSSAMSATCTSNSGNIGNSPRLAAQTPSSLLSHGPDA
jgi:hypothetical protein